MPSAPAAQTVAKFSSLVPFCDIVLTGEPPHLFNSFIVSYIKKTGPCCQRKTNAPKHPFAPIKSNSDLIYSSSQRNKEKEGTVFHVFPSLILWSCCGHKWITLFTSRKSFMTRLLPLFTLLMCFQTKERLWLSVHNKLLFRKFDRRCKLTSVDKVLDD